MRWANANFSRRFPLRMASRLWVMAAAESSVRSVVWSLELGIFLHDDRYLSVLEMMRCLILFNARRCTHITQHSSSKNSSSRLILDSPY